MSCGIAMGRRRSASARAFSGGRRGYIAPIAASASQTLVPSGRSAGNGNPSRNLSGAPGGSSKPFSRGQRYTSSDPGRSAASRHE